MEMPDVVPGQCVANHPRGWYCTRGFHIGPCAELPKWWNLKWRIWMWHRGVR